MGWYFSVHFFFLWAPGAHGRDTGAGAQAFLYLFQSGDSALLFWTPHVLYALYILSRFSKHSPTINVPDIDRVIICSNVAAQLAWLGGGCYPACAT